MKYTIITKEVWTNKYHVDANSPEEAKKILETGSLNMNYFAYNDDEKALPLYFEEFVNIDVLD